LRARRRSSPARACGQASIPTLPEMLARLSAPGAQPESGRHLVPGRHQIHTERLRTGSHAGAVRDDLGVQRPAAHTDPAGASRRRPVSIRGGPDLRNTRGALAHIPLDPPWLTGESQSAVVGRGCPDAVLAASRRTATGQKGDGSADTVQPRSGRPADHSRDPSYLYGGSLLNSAIGTAARISADPARHPPLSQTEQDFLHASDRAHRRRARRRQAFIAFLMTLVIGFASATVLAVRTSQQAAHQRDLRTADQPKRKTWETPTHNLQAVEHRPNQTPSKRP
jgi:hypothetical protein